MTGGDRFGPAPTWCPPGRAVRIAEVDIRAGGFWLGPGAEPSAVDPWLPVDLHFPDWDGATVGTLRYDRLTPAARGAYLMWLATGRRAGQAPPAWAALYLLGLERRLLLDGDDDPTLLAEARALGAVYGPADPGLADLAAGLGAPPHDLPPPPLDPATPEFPTELAVELGRRALAGTPVGADWALAWAWFDPQTPRPDAAGSAPEEFVRLWRHRFTERYPGGLAVPPRRRRLTLEYEPTNPTLPRPLERIVGDASDVVDHPVPLGVLRRITEEVGQELAPFARRAARTSDRGADTDSATAALLPDPLLAGTGAFVALAPLLDWATGRVGAGPVVVSGADLAGRWTGELDRAGSLAMAQVLERRGVGIEPDVRFGGRPVPADGPVVLFATGDTPVATPSPAYVLAAVTTELCLAVAAADGTVDDVEARLLADRIDRIDELTGPERARLAAHRTLVGERRVDLDEVAARAASLDGATRRELAGTVVDVALADGAIHDDERRAVLAVHRLLDVEPDDPRLAEPQAVEPTVRESEHPETERPEPAPPEPAAPEPVQPEPAVPEPAAPDPVQPEPTAPEPAAPEPTPPAPPVPEPTVPEPTVPEPTPPAPAVTVPGPARPVPDAPVLVPAPRAVSLDEGRLARTQASNADVRALLGAIFADPDDEPEPQDEPPAPAGDTGAERIGPLDDRHSTLLRELAAAGTWSRAELERACARLAVLPDGALDVVNEASYDLVGDPVIELQDDGSVVVDTDVLEEMRA